MEPEFSDGVDCAPVVGRPRRAAWIILLALAVSALAPVTVALAATYRVAPGDTLSGIADSYGVPVSALATENGIRDPNRILAGQVLTIPSAGQGGSPASAGTSHTVLVGETLAGIADEFGVSAAALAAANNIVNPDLIRVGQILVVPGGGVSGSGAGPTLRTHVVASGESLSGIALHYGVALADLISLNGIADPALIVEGQVLTLPAALVSPGSLHPEVREILRQAEREFGLPTGLLQAIAWQESGWQQHVVSDAGAVGVTQVLPTTALWALESLLGVVVDWQSSALDNARVGASVLAHYLDLSGGDVRISVAAYYQGWTSVQEIGFYDETKEYVANVLVLWDHFS